MLNFEQFQQARQNSQHGLPVNMPSPEQLDQGIAALGDLIGPEQARTLEWRSRLRVTRESPVAFLLLVNECLPLLGAAEGEASPWSAVADPLTSVPTFRPLEEGVALLQDPVRNPELILARRKALIEKHNAEADERRRSTLASLSAGAAPLPQFASAWQSVNPLAQALLSIAYIFANDSKVAGQLVELANQCERNGGRFSPPARAWWRDLSAAGVGG
jgi:hypothetical protein